MKMSDSVMFVSLGPGEAELITLKGLKVLQNADIVFAPSTIMSNGKVSSRAKDILLELGVDKKKIQLFNVPMNKDRSLAIAGYNEVSKQIIEEYRLEKRIAITAEGDAGFYSSIYYINENLFEANILTQRIAGIPAFIASGTLANIHIVKQEEELNVIPGVISYEELREKIVDKKNIVVMKTSQCESVIKQVMKEFSETEFHYFENVGVTNKEFYTMDKAVIESRTFPYFSLIIIQ